MVVSSVEVECTVSGVMPKPPSSDRACPCHALGDLFLPHVNLNNSYLDAYVVV